MSLFFGTFQGSYNACWEYLLNFSPYLCPLYAGICLFFKSLSLLINCTVAGDPLENKHEGLYCSVVRFCQNVAFISRSWGVFSAGAQLALQLLHSGIPSLSLCVPSQKSDRWGKVAQPSLVKYLVTIPLDTWYAAFSSWGKRASVHTFLRSYPFQEL